METYKTQSGVELEYDLLRNVDSPYHAETVAWFLSKLTPEVTFVEAGAHVGTLAVDIIKNGSQKHSILFEPNARSFQTLKRNLERNGCAKYEAHQIAILDSIGEVDFLEHADQPAMSTTLLTIFDPAAYVKVKTTTLDEALKDVEGDIILKTDTEGADVLVWEGSKTVRERIKVWYMEFMPKRVKEGLLRDPGAYLDEMTQEYLFTAMDGHHISKTEILEAGKTDICLLRR